MDHSMSGGGLKFFVMHIDVEARAYSYLRACTYIHTYGYRLTDSHELLYDIDAQQQLLNQTHTQHI